MNVLFISDFGIHHNMGGAQRSNQIILEEGFSRKHNIQVHHFDSGHLPLSELDFSRFSVVISSNLDVISKKNPGLINFLGSLDNHVRLEHDMSHYLNGQDRKILYANCRKSFFLTPHHYDCYKKYYGDYFVNVEIVPDPIDTSVFRDYENPNRSGRVLYLGYLHPLKGYDKLLEFVSSANNTVDVCGWSDDKRLTDELGKLSNCNLLNPISHDQVPALLNNYKYMFSSPLLDEPFCRSVGEAICCGVEIVPGDSKKIGCVEYLKGIGLEQFKRNVNEAQNTFWDIIEDTFK